MKITFFSRHLLSSGTLVLFPAEIGESCFGILWNWDISSSETIKMLKKGVLNDFFFQTFVMAQSVERNVVLKTRESILIHYLDILWFKT